MTRTNPTRVMVYGPALNHQERAALRRRLGTRRITCNTVSLAILASPHQLPGVAKLVQEVHGQSARTEPTVLAVVPSLADGESINRRLLEHMPEPKISTDCIIRGELVG